MANKEKIPGRGLTLTLFGWGVLFLAYFGTFALGIILPSMREELGFGLEVSGTLSSLTFVVKLLVYIPFALFAARANPKYFLAFIFLIFGVSLILHGLGSSLSVIYVGRIMMSAASAGIIGPLTLVKVNWIPRSRMPQMNGFENAITTFGQLVALSVTAALIALLGSWRMVLVAAGSIAMLIGVLWIVLFKENPAVGKIVPAQKTPFIEPLKAALKIPAVWLLAIGWPGTTLVWIAFNNFWPTYATETLGLTLAQAGFILGLIPISSIVASVTAPKLAHWIGVDKLMMWPWGIILPFAYFLGLKTSSVPLLCITFIIAGYGAYAFVPIAMTLLYKIPGIKPATISVSISFILTLTSIGGTLAGIIVGQLSSSMGLYGSMAVCCLSPLLWLVTTIFLPEYGRKAMEKKAAAAQTTQ